MISLKYMLCSDGIVEDKRTQKISVFNIIEEISSPEFPAIISKISIFGFFEREKDDASKYEYDLMIENNGNEIGKLELHMDFHDKYAHRSIVNIQGLLLPAPGVLNFRFVLDGENLGGYKMKLERKGQLPIQFEESK